MKGKYMEKKRIVKQKLIVICAFFLGIAIALYVKILDPNQVYIPLSEKESVESEINYYNEENKKLLTLLNEYNKILNEYKNKEKPVIEIMSDELRYLRMKYGDIGIEGEGIEISIKDSNRDLKENQNPNDLLVHDVDILRIINDLKKSGAEAMSINGDRLISSSEIKCSGATIIINGKTHAQPFIIKAIGDKNTLKSSLVHPDSYANLLKKSYGIYIDIVEKDKIFINSYKKHI
jgi:uncharacterized protein YlxW (UPF0749 family)